MKVLNYLRLVKGKQDIYQLKNSNRANIQRIINSSLLFSILAQYQINRSKNGKKDRKW